MRRSLPAHIVHLYDTEALSKPSPREFRTQVINQLFTKLKNGRYSLNAEKPMFQEAKKLYERKYGKDSETGLPKSVLKGLYFQNSESAFQEAISSGDVYVMNSEDGVEFFGFRKIEAGRERGTTREQSVLKEKKITADQSNCLEDLLEQLNWSFNWKKTDAKSMVEGEKLPESVLKLLTQAITSETKLSGDAFKLLKKIGDDGGADYKGLKLLYTESQTHLSDLKHIKDFKEFPGEKDPPLTKEAFDLRMKKVAAHAQKLNEAIESTKGKMKEGDTGYRTLDKFFDLLAWSFEFMFKGIHPTCNAQGEPSEQLEQLYSISALEGPAVDLCYLERLGRQKQMPSVMPGSPQQNLDLLWSEIKHLYHQHNTKVRYRYLNKLTMFLRQNGTPKLRGKAGEIRHFADIIVHLWQRHMSSELLVHKQIHLLLKLSARMEQLITDNREEIAFPAPEARKFAKACQEMLSLHAVLANHFAEEETDLFTLTSKCHMLQHISLLAGCINPRLVWCFSGEDMQNRVQQLAQASVKGNNAASAVNKI
ncbi:unnamed protein product, partial [Durusdinium trenchii]